VIEAEAWGPEVAEAAKAKAAMRMAAAAATRLGLSSSERAVKLSLDDFEWAAGYAKAGLILMT
jgi:hypothetical protein